MERRNKYEGSPKRQKEVTGNVGVKRDAGCESKRECPNDEAHAPDHSAHAGTICIQDGPYRQCRYICHYGGNGEHQVETEMLGADIQQSRATHRSSCP